jgi:hypothetical protein
MALVTVKPGDLLYGTQFGVPSGQSFQLDERVVKLAEAIKKKFPQASFGSSFRSGQHELSNHGRSDTPHSKMLALDVTIPGVKFSLTEQDAIFRDLQKFGVRGLGYAENHYHLDFIDRGKPGLYVFPDYPGATLTPNMVATDGFLPKGVIGNGVLTAGSGNKINVIVGTAIASLGMLAIGVGIFLLMRGKK